MSRIRTATVVAYPWIATTLILAIIGLPIIICPTTATEAFQYYSTTTNSKAVLLLCRQQHHHQRQSVFLHAETPRVKFSAKGETNNLVESDNPLDKALAWLSSDIVSIVLGTVGLLLVVVNRLLLIDYDDSSADALTSETRADLLAVFACGSVLLNGVTKLDVTTALAESVTLEGETLEETEFAADDNTEGKGTLSWAMDSLLTATPAKTAVLISKNNSDSDWSVMARAGVVPSNDAWTVPEKSPILDRVGSPGNVKETYLPTLQALPGRFEFTYLPSNAQLSILVPIANSSNSNNNNSVLVVGSNTAKSFSPRDIAWTRVVAERMAESL